MQQNYKLKTKHYDSIYFNCTVGSRSIIQRISGSRQVKNKKRQGGNIMKKFVAWRRVSTKQQGASGHGLAAQKQIIEYFVQAEGGELVADYSDVYTGKDLEGCTELQKAMARCREEGATLIIAKSDRFRNTVEALGIYDQMEGNIFFCDLPKTDKFTLTLFFALAEREALLVSIRTKQALAAKRAGGVKLGRPKGSDTTPAV